MNYNSLLAAVSDITDRDDATTHLARSLELVETRINRLLEDPEMEVTSTATASGDATALPADFGSMVSISTGDGPLAATGAVEFAGYDHSIIGIPRRYAIVDGAISFWPANSTANIRMVYRRTIPPLSAAAPTNWLIERAPDVYLYGVLFHTEARAGDGEAAANWKAMWDEAIAELRTDSVRRKWGAGPIAPRVRRA